MTTTATASIRLDPPAPPKLDEPAMRRDVFSPDVEFIAADGVMWYLPRPIVCLAPDAGPGGYWDHVGYDRRLGEFYRARIAYVADPNAGNYAAALASEVEMFAGLLMVNYKLTSGECHRLIGCIMGPKVDDAGRARRGLLLETAGGAISTTSTAYLRAVMLAAGLAAPGLDVHLSDARAAMSMLRFMGRLDAKEMAGGWLAERRAMQTALTTPTL